jgi:hypothetical protein
MSISNSGEIRNPNQQSGGPESLNTVIVVAIFVLLFLGIQSPWS